MRYFLRTLLIFVVAIAIGLCLFALIVGTTTAFDIKKSPLLIVVLICVATIIGCASGRIFAAMEKWAKSK